MTRHKVSEKKIFPFTQISEKILDKGVNSIGDPGSKGKVQILRTIQ
jgi:hypothetical protein